MQRTGVEMEALTVVSIAALTIYDMCKAVDKGIIISNIRLLKKQVEKRGSGVGNKSLLSVESALEKIIKDISVVSTEETSLTSAINRVTAVEVRARRCQPPVAVSAMDGYAVKSIDVKTSPRQTGMHWQRSRG